MQNILGLKVFLFEWFLKEDFVDSKEKHGSEALIELFDTKKAILQLYTQSMNSSTVSNFTLFFSLDCVSNFRPFIVKSLHIDDHDEQKLDDPTAP